MRGTFSALGGAAVGLGSLLNAISGLIFLERRFSIASSTCFFMLDKSKLGLAGAGNACLFEKLARIGRD